jgi:phosphoribosylanthranilate isomerase
VALVKVCRIDTTHGAKLAARANADFVGLHAIDPVQFDARRQETFASIVALLSTREPTCTPVLVTRSTDASFVAMALKATGAQWVQLHEAVPRSFADTLADASRAIGIPKPHIIKVFALSDADPTVLKEEVVRWLPHSDAVLFDKSSRGGTGELVDWTVAADVGTAVSHGRLLIAGGLSVENVGALVDATHVWGVDAQSSLELRGPKDPYIKSPKQVVEFVAAAKSLSSDLSWSRYRWRCSNPSVLISLSDLEERERDRMILEGARAGSNLDGFQLDVADGTADVSAKLWPPPEALAQLLRDNAPEVPLWLHVFSADVEFIERIARDVGAINNHLVGVFVQPHRGTEEASEILAKARSRLRMPVVFSVTAGMVASGGIAPVAADQGCVQVTTPGSGTLEERAQRLSSVIQSLRASGCRVHLDRQVAPSLVRSLSARPHGVTIGRALGDRPVTEAVDEMARLLEEPL